MHAIKALNLKKKIFECGGEGLGLVMKALTSKSLINIMEKFKNIKFIFNKRNKSLDNFLLGNTEKNNPKLCEKFNRIYN